MQTIPYADLGGRIRQARLKAGMTQAQLADRAEMTLRHVVRLEQGKHYPTKALMTRLASATGQSVSFFRDEPGRDRGDRDAA